MAERGNGVFHFLVADGTAHDAQTVFGAGSGSFEFYDVSVGKRVSRGGDRSHILGVAARATDLFLALRLAGRLRIIRDVLPIVPERSFLAGDLLAANSANAALRPRLRAGGRNCHRPARHFMFVVFPVCARDHRQTHGNSHDRREQRRKYSLHSSLRGSFFSLFYWEKINLSSAGHLFWAIITFFSYTNCAFYGIFEEFSATADPLFKRLRAPPPAPKVNFINFLGLFSCKRGKNMVR